VSGSTPEEGEAFVVAGALSWLTRFFPRPVRALLGRLRFWVPIALLAAAVTLIVVGSAGSCAPATG
jgi:hypothetical protein